MEQQGEGERLRTVERPRLADRLPHRRHPLLGIAADLLERRWARTPTSPSRSSRPTWSPSWVGWRYRGERPSGPPIPLTGDSRAALRPDRRRPGGPRRRGRAHAARRRARDGHRRAPAQKGARRLRHERRAPARQAGRASPPRDFADLVAAAARGGRRHRGRRDRRARASSTSRVDAGAQGVGRRRDRRGGRGVRRAARLRGSRRSTSSSSRPTRPARCTSASARWAAVGDALGRLLEATGDDVTREYYFNDHGAQIDRFSAVAAGQRARAEPTPEDGYPGQYIAEIAAAVVADHPEAPDLPDEEALEAFRAVGVGRDVRRDQGRPCRLPGAFDVYFHENDLHESGATDRAIARLRELGNIYEKDGAIWLAHREVRRRQGPGDRQVRRPRRLHLRRRGLLPRQAGARLRPLHLILLGADHHGYVGRMMALCAAFGDEPGVNLEIIIGQMVNLLSHG